jgi:hypothetical protein
MSVHEIIEELPKLSEEERELILRKLVKLDEPFEATPAMEDAIREGLRSLREERLIPRQKYVPGSPHGLRGNLFQESFSRFGADHEVHRCGQC